MKKWTLVAITFFSVFTAYTQQEKTTLQTDKYKGTIQVTPENFINTSLVLKHEPHKDNGSFVLNEDYENPKYHTAAPVTSLGSWTVLKGAALNKNATVVELDMKDRKLYFLRRKNGNLQQVDTLLREIPPVSGHILRKQ